MFLKIVGLLVLFIIFGIGYTLGYISGVTTQKATLKAFSREAKTNLKSDKFTQEALYGEGVTEDNLEPDDFEKKKQEQMIHGDRGFFS